MRRWTEDVPKALIPVLGRPFAEWQMDWLACQGVTDIVYSIGYRGDMIQAVLGDGSRWGVSVRYIDEGAQLRGTAGALRLAVDQRALDREFFVLYGDSFLTIDLAAVGEAFREVGLPALMTVLRNEGQWDRSNVIFRGDRVELYDKGAPASAEMVFIDYGLSVLTRLVIEQEVPAGAVADLADLFHQLSVQGRLGGVAATERFYEIGSEEGLRSLEGYLTAGTGEQGGAAQRR